MRSLLRQAADNLLNLDQGLLHTMGALSRRPGWMVQEYLRGRTRPFTNPVKYLIIWVALATFVYHFSGLIEAQLDWAAGDPGATEEIASIPAMDEITRYFNVLLMLGVPFMAVFSRLLFFRAGYNFTEHLIFNVFVYAHQTFLFVLTVPMYFLLDDIGWYLMLWTVLALGYYVWACRQFFEVGWFSAAWRGVMVTVFGYLGFWVLAGFFFVLLLTIGSP